MKTVLNGFIIAVRSAFEVGKQVGGALAVELDQFIKLIDQTALYDTGYNTAVSTAPALRYLDPALELAEANIAAPIARAFRPVAKLINWSLFYKENSLTKPFLRSIANTEVIGTAGPFMSKELIVGVSLIGPNTLYPVHGHQAVEIYHILAGTPHFRVGDAAWHPLPPGSFSLHPVNISHAIQTNDKPALMVYAWRGDLHAPTWFLVDSESGRREKRFASRLDSSHLRR